MVITVRKCEKTYDRPKVSELPDLFVLYGGDLKKLAAAYGHKKKQAEAWILQTDAPTQLLLRAALATAKAEAKQFESRARALQDELKVTIPLAEIKHLFTTFFTTPWAELAEADTLDLEATGYEKSTSVRTRPNPTTAETLHQLMSWADIRDIAESFGERDTHVLMAWVGQGGKSPLAQQLKAEDPPQYPVKVTLSEKESVLKAIYLRLDALLVRRPSRLNQSWDTLPPHRPPSQEMPAGCERAGADGLAWIYAHTLRPEI